jgi:hypothetical protein
MESIEIEWRLTNESSLNNPDLIRLGHENRGAFEAARAEVGKRLARRRS